MKILPPTLFLTVAAVLVLMRIFFKPLILFPFNMAGLPLIALGMYLAFAGSVKFKKEGTNIDTFKKPDKLITDGLFKYSRNPMYLGFAVAIAGLSILIGTWFSFIITAAFIFIVDTWYIRFEEQAMYKTFADEYLSYKKKTRRWI